MASSGYFYTDGGYEGRILKFAWSILSQSVENNTSTISWSLTGAGGQDGYVWYAQNFKVKINGSTVYSSASTIELGKGTLVASGSHTIGHASDGTKTFTAYAEAGIYYYAVNSQGSGSWQLPTVPRATQPTTSKSSVFYNENFTINLPRASTAFTHKIQAGVDGEHPFETIAENVATAHTWSVPKTWAAYLKTTDKRLRIRALTCNGTAYVGTKEVTPALAVKPTQDMKPVVDVTLTDENGHYGTFGGFVRAQSRIKAVINETLYASATVTGRTLLLDRVTYHAKQAVSNVITSTSQTVTATVTDSRGMQGVKTIHPTVYAWQPPRINNFTIERTTGTGTPSETGNYVKAGYDISFSPVNNKNTHLFKIGYRQTGNTTWTYETITMSGYSKTGHLILPLDGEHTWQVHYYLKDKFTTITDSRTVSTAYTLLDFHTSGRGIAVGKVSEHTNMLELADTWQIKANAVNTMGAAYLTENDPPIKHILKYETVTGENGDFNNLLAHRIYNFVTNATVSTWNNRPCGHAGWLTVLKNGNTSDQLLPAWNYGTQTYETIYGRTYVRRFQSENNATLWWSTWGAVWDKYPVINTTLTPENTNVKNVSVNTLHKNTITRMVTVNYQCQSKKTLAAEEYWTIGRIPTSYRPHQTVNFAGIAALAPVYGYIYPDGWVRIWPCATIQNGHEILTPTTSFYTTQ